MDRMDLQANVYVCHTNLILSTLSCLRNITPSHPTDRDDYLSIRICAIPIPIGPQSTSANYKTIRIKIQPISQNPSSDSVIGRQSVLKRANRVVK